MRGWTIGVATMALAAPLAAWGQLQTPRSISMQRAPEGWRPAVFVCDAIDGDRVLVLSAPDKARRAMLSVFARPGLAGQQTPVRIGAGDAGAGQQLLAERQRIGGQVRDVGVHVEGAVGGSHPVDADRTQTVEQQGAIG